MTGQGESWRESGKGDGRAAQAKPLKPFAAQAQRSLINYEHREGAARARLELRYGHVKVLSCCQQTAGRQTERLKDRKTERPRTTQSQEHKCTNPRMYVAT